MKTYLPKTLFLGLLFSFPFIAGAQEDTKAAAKAARKYMQEAEAALADNDPATAEAYYRKAIAKDPANAEAKYNLGNLYYNKEVTSQALERHRSAASTAKEKPLKHDAFHNQGNAYMKQKKYSEAVEAYKQSLRNNPEDDETRYNLALAKKMLEEEQKQGGGGDSKEKDQQDQQKQDDKQEQQDGEGEKEQNEDGQPDDKAGGDKKEDENKEGEQKKDKAGQPDDKEQKKEEQPKEGEQPKQPQQRPGQLSPQQVKNLLEAMGNEEKKVQERINAKKAKGVPVQTEKDW
ncbi:tetratricopeptide repeat protein [Salinimicrobium tongyeongense]|uniref:Tetratricopeptide repeat protein n=2 Tax=Salinimicrobium tongyeongense TaxID=2809707 RepID=A0ABY6NV53_9FLAO|nr:tetratricopeptide repeat protein [Salinimicrobium tongyeongense]